MSSQIAAAERELIALRGEADKARATLAQWQHYLSAAQNHPNAHAADLLEANEQLVVSAMQAKTEADLAMRSLIELLRTAELDALTQLPNRMLFLDRCTQALANGRRHGRRLALLFLDLNDFKQVNDRLGHSVGDAVLKEAARCMVVAVRASDTVSRHGGDEFLILLDDVSQASDAALIADKINAALSLPMRLGEHELHISASIGISLYPDDGDSVNLLIDRADAAMYRAKSLPGGGYMFHQQPQPARRSTGTAAQVAMRRPEGASEPTPQAPDSALEDRHSQLQEANEHLLLSALDAKALYEAAQQALQRYIEQMARAVHELRNPLMSIRTASAVMGRTLSDDPVQPRMNAIIERQVAHMSRLICDLLDVARINGGQLRLELSQVDLRRLIEEVVEACRPGVELRQQQLTVDVTAQALTLYGDPVRLAQVLRNLLDNASKYAPRGGEIKLTARREGHGTEAEVVLSVSDNGIGIGAQSLLHIFEPFVRDRDAVVFSEEGLGLGLTVVRELVHSHHGTVTASSPGPGAGSEFVVTLPVMPPAQ